MSNKIPFAKIEEIVNLMMSGAKVTHHGGQYCYINGKQYQAKHWKLAKMAMAEVRRKRKEIVKKIQQGKASLNAEGRVVIYDENPNASPDLIEKPKTSTITPTPLA